MRDLSLREAQLECQTRQCLEFELIGAEAAEPVVQYHTRGVGSRLCVKGACRDNRLVLSLISLTFSGMRTTNGRTEC
jgi:hypothetical protein